jgi:isopentenyl-diphosphate Delta-isomerase
VSEPVDVLTPDGVPTGQVIDKAEAHRTGAWHRAAHVWIVSGGRVLLQRRALIKENWPGKWDVSVAGHVGAGESAIDAAIREAREELGLEIEANELEPLGIVREQCVLHGGLYLDNEYHDVFLLRREINPEALVLDPNEVAEARLVELAQLEQYDLVPHPDEYVLLRSVM